MLESKVEIENKNVQMKKGKRKRVQRHFGRAGKSRNDIKESIHIE